MPMHICSYFAKHQYGKISSVTNYKSLATEHLLQNLLDSQNQFQRRHFEFSKVSRLERASKKIQFNKHMHKKNGGKENEGENKKRKENLDGNNAQPSQRRMKEENME